MQACPELEELDQFAAHPGRSTAATREHVSTCRDCQARLTELTENLALFAELEDSSSGLAATMRPIAPTPKQIGPFAIVREIGRGGMGVVYEAMQRQPERPVALKVLRGDFVASLERKRLFEREIKALARLRHPGITSIFESGTSESGPYYAMEFVQGVSLAEYARRQPLSLRDRLALFNRICAAISYAHQHGVIHRDLKPGNILVEQGGTPKILDFGLARITDVDVTGASLAMDAGRLVGTLAYMSPEQTRGVTDEIDLRSDVYSLGVILFELLSGALPYDVPRTSVPMAVRSICEASPRRPSEALQGEDAAALRGDLDTIVLKALEKSPENRYQSVSALSDDIERYLSDQAIVARPPTTIYQIRKFAKRNRVLVGGVAAVFVALGLGLITTAWQAYRARAAETLAREESATNAEISRFLTSMFASVSPELQGPDVRVVAVLKKAATEMNGAFTDQPRVAIALREALGNAYTSLTLYEEARPQFQAGLDLAKSEFGPQARQTLRLQYGLAESIAHTGSPHESLKLLRETLAVQEQLFGKNDPDTCTTKHFYAVMTVETGDPAGAEPILRDAWEGRAASLGADHEKTLDSMVNLGTLNKMLGRRDEAGQLIRGAHEAALRARGPDHPQTICLASAVAMLAYTPAELEAIEPQFRDLVERGSRAFGPDHQQTLSFMASLVQLLELRCKFDEAEPVARDLLSRLTRARGETHEVTLNTMGTLARLQSFRKVWPDAESLARKRLARSIETFGTADGRTQNAEYDLMHVLNGAGKFEEAAKLGEEAVQRRIASQGEDAVDTALTRTVLAEALRSLGRLSESREAAERSVKSMRATQSESDLLRAFAEYTLATTLGDQKHFVEAEPMLLAAHKHLAAGVGDCHPSTREARKRVVELYRQWHEAEPAAGHDRQASQFESAHPN